MEPKDSLGTSRAPKGSQAIRRDLKGPKWNLRNLKWSWESSRGPERPQGVMWVLNRSPNGISRASSNPEGPEGVLRDLNESLGTTRCNEGTFESP